MALKDRYFTVSEAAKKLEVSRQTVYRWIEDNEIPTESVGGVTLIKKKTLNKYMRKKELEAMKRYYDNLYIEQIRKELKYSDKDMIEEVNTEDGYAVYHVVRQDGKQEMVKVGGVEFTMSASRDEPEPQVVSFKLKDVKREEIEEPKEKVEKGVRNK